MVIPNSSIFVYLTENNGVFEHLLEDLSPEGDQFFNEFFAIYKAMPADLGESKAFFGMAFFMTNLHSKYIEKAYLWAKEGSPDQKRRMLNVVELIGIIITSKKENATKIFSYKRIISSENSDRPQEKVTFSEVLNLMLLNQEESRLCLL